MSGEISYWEARARALFRELDADPGIFLLGGLVSLPFNPDDGLIERYADRILWPPISEFAAAGLGVGAAMAGLRPLVAIGTSSFGFYAWSQLANEAPNVRYLSGGRTRAPVVFHVMAGSRRAGGAQHEHTPQAMLQNVPGLKIYAPGTPADIDSALHAALTGEDPALIADHVLLADARGSVPEKPDPNVERATMPREGSDVLIVAYSVMTQRALAAAAMLAREGISASVLNLRTIAPAPVADVLGAAENHPCVLFVDESRGPGSPASYLMARVFERLPDRRARLVCSAQAPAPFAPELLDKVVPTVERITEEARHLVRLGRPGPRA